MKMAPPFADLRYDAFRAIRFREDRRLFADGSRAFQMELLPPGFHFQDRIEINLVAADGRVQPVAFSTDYFDFDPDYFPFPDGRAPAGLAADMGFSGMRFRYPLNRPGVWDEVAVFQGASYFRAVAHDTLFGLSARGLAIGTARPGPRGVPDLQRASGCTSRSPATGRCACRRCSTASRSPAPSTSASSPAP